MRVAVAVAVVSALSAVLGVPSAPAQEKPTPQVGYVYGLKRNGVTVWESAPTTATTFTTPANVTASYASGYQCWEVWVTAQSWLVHTDLYTMHTNKCWTSYLGVVVNPSSFSWIVIHAWNWHDARITTTANAWYYWRSYSVYSGHWTKTYGEVRCDTLGIPGGCGWGHPWTHFYAHGDRSFYWSGGV